MCGVVVTLTCLLLCVCVCACVVQQIGDLQASFSSVQSALKSNPDHTASAELLKQLEQYFGAM